MDKDVFFVGLECQKMSTYYMVGLLWPRTFTSDLLYSLRRLAIEPKASWKPGQYLHEIAMLGGIARDEYERLKMLYIELPRLEELYLVMDEDMFAWPGIPCRPVTTLPSLREGIERFIKSIIAEWDQTSPGWRRARISNVNEWRFDDNRPMPELMLVLGGKEGFSKLLECGKSKYIEWLGNKVWEEWFEHTGYNFVKQYLQGELSLEKTAWELKEIASGYRFRRKPNKERLWTMLLVKAQTCKAPYETHVAIIKLLQRLHPQPPRGRQPRRIDYYTEEIRWTDQYGFRRLWEESTDCRFPYKDPLTT